MNIFKRIARRIKRERLIKQFKSFGKSSGFDGNCSFVGMSNIEVGNNCYFGPYCEVIALEQHFNQKLDPSIEIGNHVRMTSKARITCAKSIVIGNDVLLAPDVFITDHEHGMNPVYEGGYSPQPIIFDSVCIEDGCWLGQRVCVLPGVTIGAHSIVGANSVVTHSIPPFSIAVGSPARVIKKWDFDMKEWVRV